MVGSKNNNNSRRLKRLENGQKNWLRRLENTKIEILQYIFDIWRALLEKKIQFEEKSIKLDVYGLNWILMKV
jgi:hypothetical protein